MKTFKNIVPFLKKNAVFYFIGVVVLIAIDCLQLILPKVMREVTDGLNYGTLTTEILIRSVLIVLGTAVLINMGRVAWRISIMGTSRKLGYWLRNTIFAHFEKMSRNYFNNNKTGNLMAHATNDVQAVQMAFGPGVVMAVDSTVMTCLVIGSMVKNIRLDLTLMALAPLLLIAFTVTVLGKEVMRRFHASQDAFGVLSDKIQENISGIRVVKSFVQYDTQYKIFDKANVDYFKKYMKDVRLMLGMHPFIMFLASVSTIIAIGFGGSMVIDGSMSIGELVQFTMYLGMLVWPMMAVGMVINNIQRGMVSMKRINVILDTEPEIVDKNVDLSINSIQGEIELKNLSFTYEGSEREALSGINVKIEKGESLALIGRTGSGKTSLVNLLLRNYNVEDGMISIDGVDINRIPVEVLRRNIGYVPQENFLFSKTIQENISLHNSDESFENIDRAAEVSMIKGEIENLPLGYETELGERGVNLSGGQKQRTSIARAIVKNPRILILDDCLSAVDTNTEEKILGGLKDVMKDKTSIVISHRISTIKDSDHIAVIDEGKIVQYGNHESLLEEEGIYKDIFRKQQLEENITEVE